MKSNNFWLSEKSSEYASFACNVPSDIPAYELCYHLLQPKGKRIIDFGCFEGESSRRILERGASYVLGIDKGYEHIQAAKGQESDALHFVHVAVGGMLAPKEKFDGCMMTFVHQTINNSFEMGDAFMKIEYILDQGAPLVMLGTHPYAMDGDYKFSRPVSRNGEKEPVPFDNELVLADGTSMNVLDYNWKTSTLVGLLQRVGFDVEVLSVKRGSLEGELEAVLNKSIAKLESTGIRWKDEWKKPLYQIIVARKKTE